MWRSVLCRLTASEKSTGGEGLLSPDRKDTGKNARARLWFGDGDGVGGIEEKYKEPK